MAGRDFEQELLEAISDPRSKLGVIKTLERWRGRAIYLPAHPRNARRRQAALRMIENGMTPRETAEALCARFNISERQARRDIIHARTSMMTKV